MLLSLLFISFFSTTEANNCTAQIQENVIFLLDSSESISSSEFAQTKEFAAAIARDNLPDNTRVAAVTFSSNSYSWFNFDDDTFAGMDLGTPEQYAAALESASIPYISGTTELQRAMNLILDTVIPTAPDSETKVLCMVITDGTPTDFPCNIADEVKAAMDVVVLGITNNFNSQYVECLVDDPVGDIITVESFDDIDEFADAFGYHLCATDLSIEVTEVKSKGTGKFIELYNAGSLDFDSATLELTSNLLDQGTVTLTSYDIPPGGRMLLLDTSVSNVDCENGDNCYRFPYPFSSNDSWSIGLQQVQTFSQSTVIKNDVFSELRSWEMTGLLEVGDDYSWEKLPNHQQDQGSSWRRACFLGGSPGTANNVTCTYSCETTDPLACSAASDNSNICTQDGCTCDNNYIQSSGTCDFIPPVEGCWVNGTIVPTEGPLDKTNVVISWGIPQSHFTQVEGYRIFYTDGQSTPRSELYTPYLNEIERTLVFNDWDTFTISTIGAYTLTTQMVPEIDENGNVIGELEREEPSASLLSDAVICEVVSFTSTPTVTPTKPPSATPTLDPTTSIPSDAPSVGPSVSPTTSIPSEVPTDFPSVMPSVGPSLSPTTPLPTHNPTAQPSFAPSKAPNWDVPEAIVALPDWYGPNSDNYFYFDSYGNLHFNDTYTYDNEELIGGMKIIDAPDSQAVTIFWGLYLIQINGTDEIEQLMRNGSVTFSANTANIPKADRKDVFIDTIYNPTDVSQRHYEFRIEEAPSWHLDRFNRSWYTIGSVDSGAIYVDTYVDTQFNTSNSGSGEVPIIVWILLAVVVVAIIFIAYYFVRKQRLAKQAAEEKTKEVEQDLKYAEDGWYHDVPENQVRDNRQLKNLMNKGANKTTASAPIDRVEMITYDNDEEFKMDSHAFSPKQVQTTGARFSTQFGGDEYEDEQEITGRQGEASVVGSSSSEESVKRKPEGRPKDERLPETVDTASPEAGTRASMSTYEFEPNSLPF